MIGLDAGALVVLTAINSWIVLRAELEVAIAATGWSAGSLNGLDWSDVLLPFAVILVLAAVGCTATVTAVTGPIVFIALAAPQIGR
ncbi:hypothetical protein EV193_102118 [Herbihabitans rhizosphaerae]|uniref:FecCD transport family protein n=1 Tax=Herbihabitans rhizosphaerae TaxID=1872711 RepID=A0A4Q7L4K7_9PSEU|nr:hypothetical protein EV193_102118 [Herbihabitans rhizosphaerae]